MALLSALRIALHEENPHIVVNSLSITKTQTKSTCIKELMSLSFSGSSMAYLSPRLSNKMLHFLNYKIST